MGQSIDAKLYYERFNQLVAPDNQPVFPRSDTIILSGRVTGNDLSGLSATFTARMILEDGSVGPIVITKSSASSGSGSGSGGGSGGIIITDVNPATRLIKVYIQSADTAGFEPGQIFVFDVEFRTTGTPPLTYTIKGKFAIEEDYTLN